MTITNQKLISIIAKYSEAKVLDLLEKKIADDDARKEYHRKYNAKKNEIMKQVKIAHPELFRVA
jgi:hypothetical protein